MEGYVILCDMWCVERERDLFEGKELQISSPKGCPMALESLFVWLKESFPIN